MRVAFIEIRVHDKNRTERKQETRLHPQCKTETEQTQGYKYTEGK